MIVLDTNVISALMRSTPDERVVNWLNAQPSESIWTSSICVFEIMFGLQTMAKGKRRRALEDAFEKVLEQDLEGRVLDFDATAAFEAAIISAKLRSIGRSVEIRDVQIAGIVEARHGTLSTRNTQHFVDTGIPLVNPWDDLPA
ncbi:type II toxin-antitoxin system VapC family toxin [Bythopirellula goksoeyrii]|uniref:Toxin FitB n=1 Tax=Bythopirellula goksoeyrii TaxID=1400387 RepID=A0A5B9QJ47_9BACT|nr:type II toxin-antitoxin system VapC family toxin [Bythopirellula goksoeyrii]QEG37056.1 Toxin FitB [Bythopirellula goksoeyrii]